MSAGPLNIPTMTLHSPVLVHPMHTQEMPISDVETRLEDRTILTHERRMIVIGDVRLKLLVEMSRIGMRSSVGRML
jgi:hypothetical protein